MYKILVVAFLCVLMSGPVVADPAEVVKNSDFGWLVADGDGNLVATSDTRSTQVTTNSKTGVVTLQVQWRLPDGAPRPRRAQITDDESQGVICTNLTPFFMEILTPSGKGTTICKSFE